MSCYAASLSLRVLDSRPSEVVRNQILNLTPNIQQALSTEKLIRTGLVLGGTKVTELTCVWLIPPLEKNPMRSWRRGDYEPIGRREMSRLKARFKRHTAFVVFGDVDPGISTPVALYLSEQTFKARTGRQFHTEFETGFSEIDLWLPNEFDKENVLDRPAPQQKLETVGLLEWLQSGWLSANMRMTEICGSTYSSKDSVLCSRYDPDCSQKYFEARLRQDFSGSVSRPLITTPRPLIAFLNDKLAKSFIVGERNLLGLPRPIYDPGGSINVHRDFTQRCLLGLRKTTEGLVPFHIYATLQDALLQPLEQFQLGDDVLIPALLDSQYSFPIPAYFHD